MFQKAHGAKIDIFEPARYETVLEAMIACLKGADQPAELAMLSIHASLQVLCDMGGPEFVCGYLGSILDQLLSVEAKKSGAARQ